MQRQLSRQTAHLALLSALVTTNAAAQQGIQPDAMMLRNPAISATHIVFAYANDLYTVPTNGGIAKPLASPPGPEAFPRFSPDGDQIVFVGNYEGGRDLYVINLDNHANPASLAKRITHHPTSEIPTHWFTDKDGNEHILFTASGIVGLTRTTQLFTVSPQGGLPQQLPLPYGAMGHMSPDATTLAFTPHTRDFRTWKRYRGGMATDIWLLNLDTFDSTLVTDWEGTDTQPMFVPNSDGNTLYYLSDNGPAHRRNIWKYDRTTSQSQQVTFYENFDVALPSIGPGPNGQGEIVMQAGETLAVLDLATEQVRTIDITIPGDRPTLRDQQVNFANYTKFGSLSPEGKRVALEARGELFTVPTERGVTRRLTHTSGIAERFPVWSPNGRWIAYTADDPQQSGDGTIGEYEIYVTQSDGRGETRKVTNNAQHFRFLGAWSPDSKHLAYAEKDGSIHIANIETGQTTLVATDPWANILSASWSHDSNWLTFSLSHPDNANQQVHLYEVATATLTPVTSHMFSSFSPTFDRKGDFLYFATDRSFSARYGDYDSTWIYTDAGMIMAVPLREDVENPLLPTSDEVEWDDEQEDNEQDDSEENADSDADPEDHSDDDALSLIGTWIGEAQDPRAEEPIAITLIIEGDQANPSATLQAFGESFPVSNINWDPAAGTLSFNVLVMGENNSVSLTLDDDGELEGEWTSDNTGASGEIELERQDADDADDASDDADEEADEPLVIDIDNFEARAIRLPIDPGNLGNLAVNDNHHLIYQRSNTIEIFDIHEDDPDKREPKIVANNAASYFTLSSDGSKLLAVSNPFSDTSPARFAVGDAKAGSSPDNLDTSDMVGHVSPREEWQQIFTDAWRNFRDWFYDPAMHSVDWRAIHDQYAAMLPDAVNREDVSFLIREMISELNVGHAYYGGGDEERQSFVNTGLLGADFTLTTDDNGNAAYQITHIHHGAPWDADARGPLSQPGVDAHVGDFLLEVNGVPLDTSKDLWAAFQRLAGEETELTLSDNATVDEEDRRIIVRPIGNEAGLRYRSWVERNRQYVYDQSNGRVGYIFVPNTGVQGQTELLRQFHGQRHMDALLIDERWNGGGQIPDRFIELLNRPKSSYFARRDGRQWTTPSYSHFGPKAMLINGLAGSGGDMFPWLFRNANLGPLIGERTWGGLVGISYDPHLIDLAFLAVPRFAFYELDGTWGVEGHGVDPDIEIIADPAKLAGDLGVGDTLNDPQLDAAIQYLLEQVQQNPPKLTPPPPGPDRSGMGIPKEDY